MTPEGKVVQYIIKKARKLGGVTRKVSYEGINGAPDRLVLLQGISFFIEAKGGPNGKLSSAQEREIGLLMRSGLLCFVCYTTTDVDNAFNEALERKR